MHVFSFLVSLLVWIVCILLAIPLFLIGVIILLFTLPFDSQRRVLHLYSCVWASIYVLINPFWRVRVHGRENFHPDTAYVIVSNHQSLVDILVLYGLFRHFKWVAKAELFRVPFFGWHMRLNQYIAIKRTDRRSQFQMLKTAIRTVQRGSSVMIFPEGTRTSDGSLRRFKEGAFAIAKKAEAPILPIVINGSFYALPKSSLRMGRVRIEVDILPEIPIERVAELETRDLAAASQAAIQERLEQV